LAFPGNCSKADRRFKIFHSTYSEIQYSSLFYPLSSTFASSRRGFKGSIFVEFIANEYEFPHTFDWSTYDVALFGDDFGASGTGIEWLEKLSASANFPATISIVAKSDAQITSKALKLGAHDVLTKQPLDVLRRIRRSIRSIAASLRPLNSSLNRRQQARSGNAERDPRGIVSRYCRRTDDSFLIRPDGAGRGTLWISFSLHIPAK
jgi:CheY-like chemotaxis protein